MMKGQKEIHNEVNKLYESVPFPRWDHKNVYLNYLMKL